MSHKMQYAHYLRVTDENGAKVVYIGHYYDMGEWIQTCAIGTKGIMRKGWKS